MGGIGSGLAYAGGNTFFTVPDRGPNATHYDNNGIDDTVSYINRFQTVTMPLSPSAPGSTLPLTLSPTLTHTTLLYSATPLIYGTGAGLGDQIDGTPIGSGAPAQNTANKFYFTGRSDNFDPAKNSGNPDNARFDPGVDPRIEGRQERIHFGRIRALRLSVRPRDRRADQELRAAG